ncbi:MAG: response regulator [Bryobacteraceae bacterium]|nr:response regulator [Bryobacteraceae bacterium]
MNKEAPMQIVLVEDNEGDVFLVRRALNRQAAPYELRLARNGEDALGIVAENGIGQRPDIFVLDLNLPRFSGGEVLTEIRANPVFNDTPVMVLTSSDSSRDRVRALELGADRYFCKPTDLAAFMELGRIIQDTVREGRRKPPMPLPH